MKRKIIPMSLSLWVAVAFCGCACSTSNETQSQTQERTTQITQMQSEENRKVEQSTRLSKLFPDDIRVECVYFFQENRCFVSFFQDKTAMLGIYDAAEGFVTQIPFPSGYQLMENGILPNCVILRDGMGRSFSVYDYHLQQLASMQFETDVACFTVSENLETVYYSHLRMEQDEIYHVLYANNLEMTEPRELFCQNEIPQTANTLNGLFQIFPLGNHQLLYHGYSYPSTGVGVRSNPCYGIMDTQTGALQPIQTKLEKEWIPFAGGVASYDKSLPYGQTHSGMIDFYTPDGVTHLTLTKADESQRVFLSHSGAYLCSTLSLYDSALELDATEVAVYDTHTGKELRRERYPQSFVDVLTVDEWSDSVLLQIYEQAGAASGKLEDWTFG